MFYRAQAYLTYQRKAKTNLYIHSPFVFDLMEEVLNDKRHFYAFDAIEVLRRKLLSQHDEIEVADYGAGSHKGKQKKRHINEIAKNAAIAPKYGQLLFRLIHYFKPQTILEMGTSLGISTLYQAKANQQSTIVSIEGCPQTSAWAATNLDILDANNVVLKTGKFVDVLPKVLKDYPQLDCVFLDGHHQKEATLQYFHQLLPHFHENSILILDDIHWSKGMNEAWQEIIRHPQITVSIDLFQIGLLFFRKEQAKEHFVLKY